MKLEKRGTMNCSTKLMEPSFVESICRCCTTLILLLATSRQVSTKQMILFAEIDLLISCIRYVR
jgi:hypothetical protein